MPAATMRTPIQPLPRHRVGKRHRNEGTKAIFDTIAANGNPLTQIEVENSSWPAAKAAALRKRKNNNTGVMAPEVWAAVKPRLPGPRSSFHRLRIRSLCPGQSPG